MPTQISGGEACRRPKDGLCCRQFLHPAGRPTAGPFNLCRIAWAGTGGPGAVRGSRQRPRSGLPAFGWQGRRTISRVGIGCARRVVLRSKPRGRLRPRSPQTQSSTLNCQCRIKSIEDRRKPCDCCLRHGRKELISIFGKRMSWKRMVK